MDMNEITEELRKDCVFVSKFLDAKKNKYRRAVLKAQKFPITFKPIYYHSPLKNEWIIIKEAVSKKTADDDYMLITLICLLHENMGYFAFLLTFQNGKPWIKVYTPHFFSRYAERCEINLHGKELIARYFQKNASSTFEVTERENCVELAESTKEGVSLGVEIEGGAFLKTFITYKMLKGSQIETYTQNERMRQEIHEEEINLELSGKRSRNKKAPISRLTPMLVRLKVFLA